MPESARSLLHKLVAYDTTSRNSNLELIDFVQNYLSEFNVESQLVHDATGEKANLYATIGPMDKPGVMLSGHTDVVPVDGQDWSTNPFELVEADAKLYARGSADMKGFIACVLAAVPTMASANLHTPVHLAFSYDEEIGCIGVRTLIDMLEHHTLKPAMAIIGEPTSMQVVIGHKGKCAYEVTVTGANAHSAYTTEGVNAVIYAARLIQFVHDLQQRIVSDGPHDDDYRVPYSTLHIGTMNGGTAANIVPSNCRFDLEIRHLPQQDPAALVQEIEQFAATQLLPEMRTVYPEADIAIVQRNQYPGLFTAPEAEVVEFVKGLLGDRTHGKVSFGTEGGLFSARLGIPAVVCGPGSILQAHRADEYVSIDQLAQCDRLLTRLIAALSD
ncbi:MAG: acetylornithine deacetylase [Pseudomonadota bacterium]